MKLVIDANAVISALIANSQTREFIVTLEPDLLITAFVHEEIENYEELIDEFPFLLTGNEYDLATAFDR